MTIRAGVALLWLGSAAVLFATPAKTNVFWREALQTKQRETTYVANEIVLFSAAIDTKCATIAKLLADTQVRFHTLLFLLNAATDNPHEFVALRRELLRLQQQVTHQCLFLEDATRDLVGGIVVVNNMGHELDFIVTSAQIPADDKAVCQMRAGVQRLTTVLAAQTNKIAAALAAAQPLRAEMDVKLAEVQRDVRVLIRDMIFTRQFTILSPLMVRFVALESRQVGANLGHTLVERLPWRRADLAVLLGCTALLWLPLTGTGWWLLRRHQPHLKQLAPDAYRHARRALAWFGAAVGAYGAAWALAYPTRLVCQMLLVYCVLTAAAHAARACRLLYDNGDARLWVQPLLSFWLVLAACEVLGVTDTLHGLLNIVIIAVVMRALWQMRHRHYRRFETWAMRASLLVCGVMLVLCLAGYLRLTHVLLWLWLPLVVGLELGATVTGLAHARFVARIPQQHAALRIFLTGLGIPLVWLAIIGLQMLYIGALFGDWSLIESLLMKKLHIFGMQMDVIAVAAILFLFFIVQSLVGVLRLFFDRLASWRKLEHNVVPSLHNICTYALWAVYAIVLLRLLHVNLSSLALIASGVSVGIGFGLKDVVSNFISGMIILLGQILREGDVIEIDGKLCNVLMVNVRSTVVRTRDNAIVTIPNATVISDKLTNWTRNDPNMRRDLRVGVEYGADVQLVARLLVDATHGNAHILQEPAPKVLLADFGENALVFWLRMWIDDAADRDWIESTVRWDIHRLFAAHAVVIAFPQMDVHLDDQRVREVQA